LKKGYLSEQVKKCEKCKKIIEEKRERTNLKKYGCKNPASSQEVKNRKEKTNIRKYGCKNPFSSEIVKKRIRETLQKKYGVENPSLLDTVKNRKTKTTKERYGVENPSCFEFFRKKRKETWLKKYGTEHPFSCIEILEKRKKTWLQKYGTDNHVKKHISNLDDWENSFSEIYEKFHGNEREISKYFSVDISTIRKRALKCGLREKFVSFSSYEKEIGEFLAENEISFEFRNRNILNGSEIDILIPEYGIGIEFHGLYWHSFNNKKDKFYHYRKYMEAKNRNIVLLQIFEDEWNFSREKIREILKAFLYRNFFFIDTIDTTSKKLLIDNRFHPGDEFLRQNDFVKLAEIPPKKWYTDYVTRKRRKFGNCKDVIFDAGYELWVKK
jgi:hypothetical protein